MATKHLIRSTSVDCACRSRHDSNADGTPKHPVQKTGTISVLAGDEVLATANLDRLPHHPHVLNITSKMAIERARTGRKPPAKKQDSSVMTARQASFSDIP